MSASSSFPKAELRWAQRAASRRPASVTVIKAGKHPQAWGRKKIGTVWGGGGGVPRIATNLFGSILASIGRDKTEVLRLEAGHSVRQKGRGLFFFTSSQARHPLEILWQHFFVGGVYVEDTATHFEGDVLKGQTYVEWLTPVGGPRREFPLIFIHGGGQSGMNWLQTPDGRKGWASYFLDQGYELYLLDTASRGRSAMDLTQEYIHYPTGMAEMYWTATKDLAKWPQAKLHTQWPGSGKRGDPAFDQYYATILPSAVDFVAYQQAQKEGVSALLKRIDRPSVLVIHSQGAPAGWLAADACPHLVRAIIAVEPNGPPFAGTHPHNGSPARQWGLTDIPMEFSPNVTKPSDLHLINIPSTEEGIESVILQDESEGRTIHKLKNLQDIPVLVEVGEASYHAGFDHATVAFLKQAGVSCDFIKLEEMGIRGNGHMQMLELNNLEIAAVLHKWIEDKLLA